MSTETVLQQDSYAWTANIQLSHSLFNPVQSNVHSSACRW